MPVTAIRDAKRILNIYVCVRILSMYNMGKYTRMKFAIFGDVENAKEILVSQLIISKVPSFNSLCNVLRG